MLRKPWIYRNIVITSVSCNRNDTTRSRYEVLVGISDIAETVSSVAPRSKPIPRQLRAGFRRPRDGPASGVQTSPNSSGSLNNGAVYDSRPYAEVFDYNRNTILSRTAFIARSERFAVSLVSRRLSIAKRNAFPKPATFDPPVLRLCPANRRSSPIPHRLPARRFPALLLFHFSVSLLITDTFIADNFYRPCSNRYFITVYR